MIMHYNPRGLQHPAACGAILKADRYNYTIGKAGVSCPACLSSDLFTSTPWSLINDQQHGKPLVHCAGSLDRPALCGVGPGRAVFSNVADEITCPTCVAIIMQPGSYRLGVPITVGWNVERLEVPQNMVLRALYLLTLHLTPLRSNGAGAYHTRDEAVAMLLRYIHDTTEAKSSDHYIALLIRIALATLWEVASEKIREKASHE